MKNILPKSLTVSMQLIKSVLVRSIIVSLLCGLSQGCIDDDQTTVIARMDTFNVAVKANGELASAETAYLSPPSVTRMWRYKLNFMIPEGTTVKKGQVVARFETNKITDKLKQKRDQLSTVSKELENKILTQEKEKEDLKVQLARREMEARKTERKVKQIDFTTSNIDSQKLIIDQKIAKQDLELYREKVKRLTAKASLEMSIKQSEKTHLESEVSKLRKDVAKLTVKAPKAGLFIYGNNFEGDKFSVGDTLHSGQNFAEIPSLDKMIVKAKISERNLGKVRTGMSVEIVLDANSENKYSGTLISLGAVIQAKAKNNPEKVIEAEIQINEPDRKIMRPGMIARLSVVVDTHKDVIVLPTQAVLLLDGEATVRIKSTFGETKRTVKVVAFDDDTTAINEGLSVGEEVIL
ncbi:MAG: HlyD family efflux transporter periplasmic adaptor subunit [Psychrosphaera sp.]|nr:HlyD family efflux transporter periplasmic adaptor subunit [Psychrosphaera sp.]